MAENHWKKKQWKTTIWIIALGLWLIVKFVAQYFQYAFEKPDTIDNVIGNE